MPRTIQSGRLILVCGLGAMLCVLGWLWWKCQHDPRIIFLPERPGAEWILYPNPPQVGARRIIPMTTAFRRSFVSAPGTAAANLQICAFGSFTVSVNGVAVPIKEPANWKQPQAMVLDGFLREGTNTLMVSVTASNGPPALWLALEGSGGSAGSDARWEASLAGAAWRPARLATAPLLLGGGALSRPDEKPWTSLTRNLPTLLAGTLVALGLLAGGRYVVQRVTSDGNAASPEVQAAPDSEDPSLANRLRRLDKSVWMLVGVIALWLAIFLNNASVLPRAVGFDAPAHLEYIQYILDRHRLPLPHEGWSMFHPPLYYTAAAATLGLARKSINDESGVYLLRIMGLGIGLTHLALIWASLRLLFPAKLRKQAAGLALAALLPAHLCLAHFVSNELLAATLVTACFYLCLRLLRATQPSTALYVGTGICLGAALLAKMTAILAIPFVVGVVIYTAWQQPGSARRTAWKGVTLSALTCLLVAGWYYGWIWSHYGTPLVGNWDAAQGATWWQDAGYRTGAYYLRFGQVFERPFFSGSASCADGLYSTLWGDGLYAGMSSWENRLPWNYHWMAAGYLLALVPTTLLVVGAVVRVIQMVRSPGLESMVLVGFPVVALLVFLYLTLKVPSYAQVKSFYLLSALLPLCVLVAEGWEWLTQSRRAAIWTGMTMMVAWGMGAVCAFWIHSDSSSMDMARGHEFFQGVRFEEAARHYQRVIERDPENASAGAALVQSLAAMGRADEALELAGRLIQKFPNTADVHAAAAEAWLAKRQPAYSFRFAQSGIRLDPDNLTAHLALVNTQLRAGASGDLAMACREALRIAPDNVVLHQLLGMALSVSQDSLSSQSKQHLAEARQQLCLAGDLANGRAEILGMVAWVLATHPAADIRDGAKALIYARRATQLTPQAPQTVFALAAAQAETGDFKAALATAEHVQTLMGKNEGVMAEKLKRMLAKFQAGEPYHESAR